MIIYLHQKDIESYKKWVGTSQIFRSEELVENNIYKLVGVNFTSEVRIKNYVEQYSAPCIFSINESLQTYGYLFNPHGESEYISFTIDINLMDTEDAVDKYRAAHLTEQQYQYAAIAALNRLVDL